MILPVQVTEASASAYWWAQPIATVAAGLFVILAAWLTFCSQEKNRRQDNDHHGQKLDEERKARDKIINAQKEEWIARLRHEGLRNRLERLTLVYADFAERMLYFGVLIALRESAEREKLSEDELTQMRADYIRKSLSEEIKGQTLLGLIAQVKLLGSEEVSSDIERWIGAALEGRPSDEIHQLKVNTEACMKKHLETLENGAPDI